MIVAASIQDISLITQEMNGCNDVDCQSIMEREKGYRSI